MTGPLWVQLLVGLAVGIPVVVVLGAVVTLAVGGVLGCVECVLARFGNGRMAPGVVSIRRGGHAPVTGA